MGGCSSEGGCSSGGCNRMDVNDWFTNIQYDDTYTLTEVSFNEGAHKDFFDNKSKIPLFKGDFVTVDMGNGNYHIGQVSLTGELVKLQLKKKRVRENTEFGVIKHKSTEEEIKKYKKVQEREQDTLIKSRLIVRELKLKMKISEVRYYADGRKAVFYFIADGRVDFRELIKRYVSAFKIKVEMKHIGARQEAARIGGIGSCGRELCCSSWLNKFPSVVTQAARYQDLAINIDKLSGQCGRLKCCLNYELSQYVEAVQDFPKKYNILKTKEGTAVLRKTEILKKQAIYTYKDNPLSDYYRISMDDVKEIISMNKKGNFPESLSKIAIVEEEVQEKQMVEDLVGQIQLQTLEKPKKKNKKRRNKRKNFNQKRNRNNPQNNKKKG